MKLPWTRDPDPRAAAYLAGTPRRLKKSTPLDELPLVVLDAETTGFDVHRDQLLSLAAMPVRRGRADAGGLRNWLVHRPEADVNQATRIHTILPSDLRRGVPEASLLEQLCPMLTGAVLVGHHIGFDAAVLDRALRHRLACGLRNPAIDTAQLAMRALDPYRRTGYAAQRPPGLDEVCAHLGIPLWERHTADGDTFATAQLFLLLCARLRRKLGRPLVVGDFPILKPPG